MQFNFKNSGGEMTSATGTFRASCGGTDIASTTVSTLDTANSTVRFMTTITGTMPFATVCQVSTSDVKGSGPGGTSAAVSAMLTFTTKTAPACTSPAMRNSVGTCVSPPAATGYTWNDVIKVWVADIDVLVTGLNMLPQACVTFGDACWKASTADGTIKYFATGMVINGRKQVMAGYRLYSSNAASVTFAMVPFYLDTEADTPVLNKSVSSAYTTDGFASGKGNQVGVKFITPTNICGEYYFTGSGIGTRLISCPI